MDAFPAMEFDFIAVQSALRQSWKKDLGSDVWQTDARPSFQVMHDGEERSRRQRAPATSVAFLANPGVEYDPRPPRPYCRSPQRLVAVHWRRRTGQSNIRAGCSRKRLARSPRRAGGRLICSTNRQSPLTSGWCPTGRMHERKARCSSLTPRNGSSPLRKNLGKKNCELAPEHILHLRQPTFGFKEPNSRRFFPDKASLYGMFHELPFAFPAGYAEITIEALRFVRR